MAGYSAPVLTSYLYKMTIKSVQAIRIDQGPKHHLYKQYSYEAFEDCTLMCADGPKDNWAENRPETTDLPTNSSKAKKHTSGSK